MVLVLVYGVALLAAVLVSGVAARTVLSTSLLFLLAGALVGQGVLGLVHVGPDDPLVETAADLALFTVLFTDGMKASLPRLRGVWRQPARALLVGMPLTALLIALGAHVLAGLPWLPAFLVGAVLAPTDPVFASALVSRTEVPVRLRQLLNVESGLNDGLALPVVLVLLAAAGPQGNAMPSDVLALLAEVGLGLALGVVLPLVAVALFRIPRLGATPGLQPLGPVALGVLLYALCSLTHANDYLAAFAAGATLATVSPRAEHAFHALGEQLSELAKFAALLVFGALLTPDLFGRVGVGGYVAAVLFLVVARPVPVVASLAGTGLPRREKLVAAWFGPKGFASVVYGLLVLHSGIPEGRGVFDLVAVTIALSIFLHSSSDVPVARAFGVEREIGAEPDGGRSGPSPGRRRPEDEQGDTETVDVSDSGAGVP